MNMVMKSPLQGQVLPVAVTAQHPVTDGPLLYKPAKGG